MAEHQRYVSKHKIRVVTAASLFDGHDAAINIMRRILQSSGAEVIHLGHNRSALEVVNAAIQEDAQAIAVSSYQGGHMEYFRYMRSLLDERGATHIRIFGGGGGVIVPAEIRQLEGEGAVDRIYSPEDGRKVGLQGLIDDILERSDFHTVQRAPATLEAVEQGDVNALARFITLVEGEEGLDDGDKERIRAHSERSVPVVGITGTGGAGKSSLTDELLRRFLLDGEGRRIAVLSVDPTRKRTGGALLGDRIRMNALRNGDVFMRSLATRSQKGELSAATGDAIALCKAAGYDLVVLETSGIGQGDADVVELADLTLYVMTPEFGAPSQLEKIDMLDYADLVAINKAEKRGAADALRDVRKQVRRNRGLWDADEATLPVFGTVASRFADPGVDGLYLQLLKLLNERFSLDFRSELVEPAERLSPGSRALVPADRQRYLAEISSTCRTYREQAEGQARAVRKVQSLQVALREVSDTEAAPIVAERLKAAQDGVQPPVRDYVASWTDKVAAYGSDEFVYQVRGREIRQPASHTSLSHQRIPRVALPHTEDHGTIARYGLLEGVPGEFPFTAGVFPLKRLDEEPKRMFAGEGGPAKTNRRFHYLCEGEAVHRLSTAFDSVTLYGEDPAERPDIYGKVGESGVSVPHLDDMKILYGGFDLCARTTSVSMTINGPAPILLAFFFNTAIDQQIEAFVQAEGRQPTEAERSEVASRAVSTVRGTVQADILKEDQAQNTCIFSTEFALRMMGDIQSWFVEHDVRNFYSVSISGYHIAEAGANPISQLAFTLANGFTLVEYYLSRGMDIDAFAPNLSFFFSNGLDPEYTVIGRVARRIWSVAMRDRYGAGERSQKLKYHIQTSGRSLHAREIQFNDIRTTLQALLAISDHCNSLHTNAYDEAITTPTEESVRRAMAIQMIINRELGMAKNENPLQGSHFVEHLTDLVEEAVLQEFERISDRGGVLGAMELQYQRSKIQEESLHYEHLKHDGSLPIIGVNTYLDPATTGEDWEPPEVELRRSTNEEKDAQIDSVQRFQQAHADEAPAALKRLQKVALEGGNIFDELMKVSRVATLGQISAALYAVGGEYRRNL
ncbi:MAG: methylmalonyl-CoA mutase family protein [Myxococcales bacterium]|nr:methylmalonyl-CoA mutase family protein [Myxococcales bacterium]